jgi:hypothetical protein
MRVPEDFLRCLLAHRSCSDAILRRARQMTAEEVECSPHPEAVRIRRMVKSVLAECHRMRGFVRLKPLGAFVLYGRLKPRHRIGGHVCDFFARRAPKTMILLGKSIESWHPSIWTEYPRAPAAWG